PKRLRLRPLRPRRPRPPLLPRPTRRRTQPRSKRHGQVKGGGVPRGPAAFVFSQGASGGSWGAAASTRASSSVAEGVWMGASGIVPRVPASCAIVLSLNEGTTLFRLITTDPGATAETAFVPVPVSTRSSVKVPVTFAAFTFTADVPAGSNP